MERTQKELYLGQKQSVFPEKTRCFSRKNTLYVIARVVSNTFRNAPSCGHKSLCIFYEDFWKIYILKTPVNKGVSGVLCSYVYFFCVFSSRKKNITISHRKHLMIGGCDIVIL